MEDLKNKTIKELADRLNQIMIERKNLYLEFTAIAEEIWERIPDLKDDPDLQISEGPDEFDRALAGTFGRRR